MAIPLLGLSLGDLGVVGSQVYGAKAAGEDEARRVQQEENERKRQRRREALESALTELQIDRTRMGNERLSRGEAPIPSQASQQPPEPENMTPEEFNDWVERFGEITTVRAGRERTLAEARAAGRAAGTPNRQERPDAPPSDTEVQRTARGLVSSYLTRIPGATPEEVVEQVPEMIAAMPESEEKKALQLMLEGGRLNEHTLRAAYQNEFDPRAAQQAQRQSFANTLEAQCRQGYTSEQLIDANRGAAASTLFDDEEEFEDFVYTICGDG